MTRQRPSRAYWAALLAVAVAAIAVDQVTKAVVRGQMAVGETRELGLLEIRHVRNSGIVHGLFQGAAVPVGIATVVVIVGMVVYFARNGARSPLLPVAFGLLVGGSVGNLADRLRLGYVTDFVGRAGGGGAFNLADVAIVLALATLLVLALTGERPRASRAGEASASESPPV